MVIPDFTIFGGRKVPDDVNYRRHGSQYQHIAKPRLQNTSVRARVASSVLSTLYLSCYPFSLYP
jgi:hypothetical protein